jgi:hypothetical protein
VVIACGVGVVVPAAGAVTGHAQAEAKQHLLRLSDLPKGWKMTGAPSSTTKTTGTFTQLGSCESISTQGIPSNPPNESEAFSTHGGVENLVESIAEFRSVAVAKRSNLLFTSAKAKSCISTDLLKSMSKTTTGKPTLAKATTAPLTLPHLGTASSGFELRVPLKLKTGNQTVTLVADFVAIRSGKAIAIVSAIYAATALSADFTRSMAKKASSRLH